MANLKIAICLVLAYCTVFASCRQSCQGPATLVNGVCTCNAGYIGNKCQFLINLCSRNPCANNATCTAVNATATTAGSFSCACTTGFIGTTCAYPTNPCLMDCQCKNNATCTPVVMNTFVNNRLVKGNYTCACTAGFIGAKCQYSNNPCIEQNHSHDHREKRDDDSREGGRHMGGGRRGRGPCRHNGTCSATVLNTVANNTLVNGNYSCACATGYIGAKCQFAVNSCMNWRSNLCQHGSNCTSVSDTTLAANGTAVYGTVSCACTANYLGPLCQYIVNPCLNNPCHKKNLKTCTYVAGTASANGVVTCTK